MNSTTIFQFEKYYVKMEITWSISWIFFQCLFGYISESVYVFLNSWKFIWVEWMCSLKVIIVAIKTITVEQWFEGHVPFFRMCVF